MTTRPEDRRIFSHVTVAENVDMARHATSAARPAIPSGEVLASIPMLTL